MGKEWTAEEENFIKENYEKFSYDEIAVKLNRTKKSVIHKAGILGLKRHERNSWTEDQIKVLKENFDNMSLNELATLLSRDLGSVRDKCKGLGLHRGTRKHWTDEERKFISENYDKLTFGEIGKVLGRTAKAVVHYCNKMGLKKPHPWDEIDIEFIRNNYQEFTNEEIAEYLGITKHQVSNIARKFDLKKELEEIQIGDVFFRLTVVGEPYMKSTPSGPVKFVRCSCECDGKIIEVRKTALKSGTTKSCGCYNREAASERMSKMNEPKMHGLVDHPLYGSWTVMKNRCYNKASPIYLGDGFEVYEDWKKSFVSFYEWALENGWCDGLVLSRKNENLGFFPDNCYFRSRGDVIIENQDLEKSRQTCLEKYGVDHPQKSKEVREKSEKTNLEKYGYKTPLQSEEIKEKIRQTNLEKYGVEYPTKLETFKEKVKQSNLAKYGVEHPMYLDETKQKIVDTNIARYGEPYPNKCNKDEQNSIKRWLEELGLLFFPDHKVLNRKEIDLYNDELKIGIEYCGLYWHCENSRTPRLRSYHFGKYDLARSKGVRLITIFSDEWRNRQNQVKGFLRSLFGKNENKIYARKCRVTTTPASDFIEKYHIQGQKRASKKYINLEYGDRIVGSMSLNQHHRQGHENVLVLNRLCFLDNTTVVGGASRLFEIAVEYARTNKYNKIVSWSDNRWSSGAIYNILGFKLEKEIPPDYSYVDMAKPYRRHSKQSMSKRKLGCPGNISEHEYALSLGYSRIWDCGKKRFVFEIN